MNFLELADREVQTAHQLLEESGIVGAWEQIGATVYLVGSCRTGLMMGSRDIDMHIYTDRVDVGESFSVMRELAARLPLREIHYGNGLDTDEECIEWHAVYTAEGVPWKFDMIHIRRGSRYDGVVERVTEAIREKLTPELREAILRIKYEMPENEAIPGVNTGINIYRAVFAGIRHYKELGAWLKANPIDNTLDWMP